MSEDSTEEATLTERHKIANACGANARTCLTHAENATDRAVADRWRIRSAEWERLQVLAVHGVDARKLVGLRAALASLSEEIETVVSGAEVPR